LINHVALIRLVDVAARHLSGRGQLLPEEEETEEEETEEEEEEETASTPTP
jgi:hypothetical protein